MNDAHEINKKYYNDNVAFWSTKKTHSFFHEDGFRLFESKLREGDTVLDIGCAYGIHIPMFLGIGRKLAYEGIDISENMISIAEGHYPQLTFHVGNIVTDSKELFGEKKFDGFWAAAVFMHVPKDEWDALLGSVEDIMNPGAFGYITIPNERPNEESEKDRRHFSLFTEEEFIERIQERGWGLVERGGFPKDERGIWHWYIVKLP